MSVLALDCFLSCWVSYRAPFLVLALMLGYATGCTTYCLCITTQGAKMKCLLFLCWAGGMPAVRLVVFGWYYDWSVPESASELVVDGCVVYWGGIETFSFHGFDLKNLVIDWINQWGGFDNSIQKLTKSWHIGINSFEIPAVTTYRKNAYVTSWAI